MLILKITATDQDGNKNDDEACGITLSAFHAGRMQCATRITSAKSPAGQNEPGTFTEYGVTLQGPGRTPNNSDVQKINVTGFERFQGSYELKGYTARKEGFVCSFDADGQFLHLSMR